VTVTAPPRPPSRGDPIDRDELEALVEALIEEARQRQRRRRRIFWAVVAAAAVGAGGVFIAFERTANSETGAAAARAGGGAANGSGPPQIAFMTGPSSSQLANGQLLTTLYVVNADGSGKRILTRTGWSIEAPAWSPDGQKLAFERRVSPLVKGQCACDIDLFTMNVDGSGQKNLTRNPVYDRRPVWSPDAQRLAFVRYRDVWVMNADGSDQRRLTPNPQGDDRPVWSPDGQQIAYTSFRTRNWDVWVMKADGSGQRNLTRNRAQDYFPTWSPNGRKIAFIRTRNSSRLHGHPWELWVMNADGSGQRNLARGSGHGDGPPWSWSDTEAVMPAPSWSPDGRKLLFASHHDGNPEIYVVNADGSGQRRLTRDPAEDTDPSWSPDGREIAFISTRDGKHGIYVMTADGSRQRNITRGIPRIGAGFAWSPGT
jgi:Tol biopolymer transport system component